MFKALQAQSYSFYDKNRTGDIMAKTTSDVQVMNQFLSNDFGNIIRDAITLMVILFLVFNINVYLSLIFLAIVPVLFGLMIWYRKKMFATYYKMANKSGELNSVLQENVTGVRVVKAFGREKYEMEKYKKTNSDFLKSNLEVIKLSSNYGPFQEFITMMGSVLLLFIGGYMVLSSIQLPGMNAPMSIGEIVTFYALFSFLYDPIRNLVNTLFNFSSVQASLVRVNSILENKSEIVETTSPVVPEKIEGAYTFDNVWFSYDTDEHYVLRNITFNVKAGERIAILGATGSGKSTLINLIPRFYDPTKGKILIDGIDVKDLKIDEYRRHIGIVSQDVFLFSQSIGENIAYGKQGRVKQEEIEAAAKIASIHNFISSLPDGYKTKVGERGQSLSGGQKQRVAIARALLLQPKVLILDDSLSAVDIDTEVQIQKALDTLASRQTTFIITQRISTIQNCDRILVLDNGEIIELGTHDELYVKNGIYTRVYNTMYKAQTKREIPAVVQPTTPFEQLPPSDAKVVESFYLEKYTNEERAQKVMERKAQKLEKEKLKEEQKEARKMKKNQDDDEDLDEPTEPKSKSEENN